MVYYILQSCSRDISSTNKLMMMMMMMMMMNDYGNASVDFDFTTVLPGRFCGKNMSRAGV